ncbi:hypothetical protein KEJ37_04325 [Candidatus Bathyarchaeota archaeon]|nr:hypothetical protein [Candidatus Bathyarchaeota archaeon]
MTGTELLKRLPRGNPKMMKSLVMVTDRPNLQNAVEALSYNANAYLMKPNNHEKLLKVIEEKLEKQREEETLKAEKLSFCEDKNLKVALKDGGENQ